MGALPVILIHVIGCYDRQNQTYSECDHTHKLYSHMNMMPVIDSKYTAISPAPHSYSAPSSNKHLAMFVADLVAEANTVPRGMTTPQPSAISHPWAVNFELSALIVLLSQLVRSRLKDPAPVWYLQCIPHHHCTKAKHLGERAPSVCEIAH